MDIVIDSNIFYNRYSMEGPQFDLLFDAVYAHVGRMCIPQVVVAEVESLYGRYLRSSSSRATHVPLGVEVDVDSQVSDYRAAFTKFITNHGLILPYPKVSHEDLVTRDLKRRKPFKENGSGYRDCLIWETVLSHLRNGSRNVALITGNHKDFGKAPSLHPDLQADMKDPSRVQYFASLEEFNETVVRPRLRVLAEANAMAMADVLHWMRGGMIADLEGIDVLAGQGEERIRPMYLIDWHNIQVEESDAPGNRARRIRLRTQADVRFWIERRFDWLVRRMGPKDTLGRPPTEQFSPTGRSRVERIDVEMEFEVCKGLDSLLGGEVLSLRSPFHAPYQHERDCA